MELIFNPCCEFRWSPKDPESQIHSPHVHVGAPGIFSDLLRFFQMLKRESGVRKATGSYSTYSSLVKLQPWFLSLRWKTCFWAELQPWCLRLQWKTCPYAEHTDLRVWIAKSFFYSCYLETLQHLDIAQGWPTRDTPRTTWDVDNLDRVTLH